MCRVIIMETPTAGSEAPKAIDGAMADGEAPSNMFGAGGMVVAEGADADMIRALLAGAQLSQQAAAAGSSSTAAAPRAIERFRVAGEGEDGVPAGAIVLSSLTTGAPPAASAASPPSGEVCGGDTLVSAADFGEGPTPSKEWSLVRPETSGGVVCRGDSVSLAPLPGSVWGSFGRERPASNLLVWERFVTSLGESTSASASEGERKGNEACEAGLVECLGEAKTKGGSACALARYAIEASVSLEPTCWGEQAGVFLYANDAEWLKVVVEVRLGRTRVASRCLG